MTTRARVAVSLAAAVMIANSTGQDFRGRTALEEEYRANAGLPGESVKYTAVRDHNRASRLVGMKVRNHVNQDLGTIEDIMINLDSGRVAYAVLAVDRRLGLGEKRMAIPLAAFTPAPGQNEMILHADIAKIEAAPGFSQNNWPPLDVPLWGADRYWDPRSTAYSDFSSDRFRRDDPPDYDRDRFGRYYPDRYRSDRDDFDRNRYGEYRSDRSYTDRYDRDRGRDDNRRPGAFNRYEDVRYRDQSSAFRQVFKGKITAVNPETRLLTVENEWGRLREFVIDDKPAITLKDNRNPKIVDLKVGFPVSVGYYEEPDGTFVAQSITRTDTPEVK